MSRKLVTRKRNICESNFRKDFPDETKVIALQIFYLESCDKPNIKEIEKLINLAETSIRQNWLQTVHIHTKVVNINFEYKLASGYKCKRIYKYVK